MAIAHCPACGRSLSTSAVACPHCAYPQRLPIARSGSATAQPIWKFVLLCLVTWTFYELYWCYWSWVYLRERRNLMITPLSTPFWRALFSPLYAFTLFRLILEVAREKGYAAKYPAGWLAVGYALTSFFPILPHPYWVATCASVVFVLPAFRALDFARRADQPELSERQGFSPGEWVMVGIGGLLWSGFLFRLFFTCGRAPRLWRRIGTAMLTGRGSGARCCRWPSRCWRRSASATSTYR